MFKVGDKVRPIGNPIELPDENSVGSFIYRDWNREFTVRQVGRSDFSVRLEEDDGDWWWDNDWLEFATKIHVGGE